MSRLRDPDPSLDQFVDVIAKQLQEATQEARDQINRAIQIAGMEVVCKLVTEANEQHISANPPMVKDGSRQRTLGGCFFQLLRENTNTSQRHKIFPWYGPHYPKVTK